MAALVLRALDGRIIKLVEDGSPVMELKDDSWVPAKGIPVAAIRESRPLRDDEIEDLVAKGILSR
jgi:hypothetical protein